MINDPIILNSYKNGKKKAFLFLYNKYAMPLRKFLHGGFSFSSQGRICRFKGIDHSMDVDSIIQETFARAFLPTTRQNYDGERPFQTYLFSIAKNLVLRECHHRERLVTFDQMDDSFEINRNLPALGRDTFGESPENIAQNKQLSAITEGFFQKLNEEERIFFNWRFSEGLTQEATAKTMDTTRARIKLLEKNIRSRFLSILKKNGYLIEHRLKPRWKRKDAFLAQN